MPSDVPMNTDRLRGGSTQLTDTHGNPVDTSTDVGRYEGGIPIVPKYVITKSDMSDVDPSAEYFVFRVDTDEDSRDALLFYAQRVKDTNPKLAADIKKMVESYG